MWNSWKGILYWTARHWIDSLAIQDPVWGKWRQGGVGVFTIHTGRILWMTTQAPDWGMMRTIMVKLHPNSQSMDIRSTKQAPWIGLIFTAKNCIGPCKGLSLIRSGDTSWCKHKTSQHWQLMLVSQCVKCCFYGTPCILFHSSGVQQCFLTCLWGFLLIYEATYHKGSWYELVLSRVSYVWPSKSTSKSIWMVVMTKMPLMRMMMAWWWWRCCWWEW